MAALKIKIEGAFVINEKPFNDKRGSFAENWDRTKYDYYGLSFYPDNSCISFNKTVHTLRGFHYQEEPFGQSKIVSCVNGKILDVILDLRRDSPSYMQWFAKELAAFDGQSIYIPKGCAHGFLTLDDNAIVSYLIEGEYRPDYARTVRWDDPKFQIPWPVSDPIISEKDSSAPDIKL